MEDHFTNAEIPLADLPRYQTVSFHPVSPKQRSKSVLSISLFFVLLVIIGGVYFYYSIANWVSIVAATVVGLFFIIQYLDAILRQRYYGYAIREHDLLYRRGYLVTKLTAIPFNRIQHVEVSQNILDKLFKIASLNVYTAGGSGSDISIPGLSPEMANTLKDRISQKVGNDEH